MHKIYQNYNTMLTHLDSAQIPLQSSFEVLVDVDYKIIKEFLAVDEPEKEIFFFHKDHLGSSTQITDMGQHVIHHIEYMPTGEQFLEQRDYWHTPYRFNGKELDAETGLYYYGARYYTPEVGIWLSVDPLADKYPSISSFAYCLNNPVKLIDPNGMEVEISGDAQKDYYKQVKAGAKALGISVKMDKNGVLSATYKGKEDISKDGQKFLDAVNCKDVKVKINATNSDYVDDGRPFVGGAFMGNTVEGKKATANQTVNPKDLNIIDSYYGTPGKTSIHEITEAHQGGLISIGNGTSSSSAGNPNSVSKAAHEAATSQSGMIYENRYDAQDNWLKKEDWGKAKWIDYNVGKPPHDKNIKTIKLY